MLKHDKSIVHKSNIESREEGIVLLNNAIKALSMAEPLIDEIYIKLDDNYANKNWACYMLQQSIELALKGIIKYYYEDFRQGHFVRFNAEYIEELAEKYFELREIQNELFILKGAIAVTLGKWQAIGRYKKLRVTNDQIKNVYDISDSLIRFIKRHNLNTEL